MNTQFLNMYQGVQLSHGISNDDSRKRKSSAQQLQQENEEKIAKTVVDAVLDSTTISKVVDDRSGSSQIITTKDEFTVMIEVLKEYKKEHGNFFPFYDIYGINSLTS